MCIDPLPRKAHSQLLGPHQERQSTNISSLLTAPQHMALPIALLSIKSSLNPNTSSMFSYLLPPQLFPACRIITSNNPRSSPLFIGHTTQKALSKTRLRLPLKVQGHAATLLCIPNTPRGLCIWLPAPHQVPLQEGFL